MESQVGKIDDALKISIRNQQKDADYLDADSTTIAAAGVLARSYEGILYRVQKAQEYLYF